MATITPVQPVLRLQPSARWRALSLRDLWEYRELLIMLVTRDLRVRYKQTALGASWAILQPLASMAIFSIFFGRLVKVPSDNVPYPIFALAGLVPWMYFSNSLGQSSNSVVGCVSLITKVYFPRLILPLSSVISGIADLLVGFALLLAMTLYYGIVPGVRLLVLPGFVLLAITACLGVGLWLSAVNVRYRDVRYITPFLIQFWMYATPVVYPSSLLKEPWRTLFALNPMVGVVEGFRWSILNTDTFPWAMVGCSAAVAITLLVSGLVCFRAMERSFADVI